VILPRALILIACVLAVSACGSATTEQSADQPPVAYSPSPKIEAIDEAADAWWLEQPNASDGDASVSTTWCLQYSTDPSEGGECPSEKKNELRRKEQEFARATAPATGSEPRAIARLRLENRRGNGNIRLIAWKSTSGKLCLADDESDEEGGGGGGPFGPCEPGGHCPAICLTHSGDLVGREWMDTTAGVLSAKADVLRVTFDDGRVASYRLNGPLVPGFPEYRVFMLDLGRMFETRVELFDGDEMIAEEKRTDAEIRLMRCDRQFPPTTPFPTDEREKSLTKCLERATGK
jgi:hypothetical protein